MSETVQRAAASVYQGVWTGLVQYFRVPHEPPSLPVRADDRMDSFRPALGFLRYLKLFFWIICLLIDLGLLALWIVILINKAWVAWVLSPLFLLIMIAPYIVAYVAIHLRYDTTWYVLTSRSLRIRRGIWIIHETTITFENIQNIKVTQGPLQRYFGIADIVVETAGSGGGGGGGQSQQGGLSNQGIIEGVANAPEIRDLILNRMKQSKTAGLGDEDDAIDRPARMAWSPEHLATLREIRDAITV